MKKIGGKIYRFGKFELQTDELRLVHENKELPLTQKALKTLLFLVENQNKVVEREELLDAIWGDSIVEENVLSVNVSMLRKVLRKNGGKKLIKTYPRRGYQFVAEVQVMHPESRDDLLIIEKRTLTEITIEETDTDKDSAKTKRLRLLPKTTNKLNYLFAGFLALLLIGIGFAYSWQRTDSATTRINSIAVLPLKAIGESENEKVLGLGIADSLITELGTTKEIIVRPTSSIIRYAETNNNVLEIGRELKVDAILEGTFQQSDGKFRINAKLLRVSDGEQIWAGTFDESEDEIFKLQDAFTARILDSLTIRLAPAVEVQFSKKYTENKEAYKFYLRGRYFFDKRSIKNYQKAISEYQKALELDDKYALAYTGLADAYSLLGNNSKEEKKRREYYVRAKLSAQKALEIAPNLSEAYTSLGWIRRNYEWDWQGAKEAFEKAIQINPNNVNAQRWYGLLLTNLGETDEGVAQLRKAVELDPLSTVVNSHLAWMLYFSGKYDESIKQLEQTLDLDPKHIPSRRLLVSNYLMKRKFAEALEEIGKIPDTPEHRLHLEIMKAIAENGLGNSEKGKLMLEDISRKNIDNTAANYYLATAYTKFGQNEKALDLLERALEKRDDRMVWINVQSEFEPLRNTPRFQEILKELNLS